MATETSTQREKQEQSIKARKHELFVDEPLGQDGPRKTFRECLRETPAAPLTKNVKLMLWGSAAPVVLLFFGALLTGKGAAPKPPSETVLPPSLVKPQVLVTPKSEEKPPKEADAPAGDSTKGEAGEKPKKPPEEKPSRPRTGRQSPRPTSPRRTITTRKTRRRTGTRRSRGRRERTTIPRTSPTSSPAKTRARRHPPRPKSPGGNHSSKRRKRPSSPIPSGMARRRTRRAIPTSRRRAPRPIRAWTSPEGRRPRRKAWFETARARPGNFPSGRSPGRARIDTGRVRYRTRAGVPRAGTEVAG
jgi:hypothetical protein